MMVEMPLNDMTQEKKDTLEELIRSYVFDIVRAEDIQNLKDEGIIKNVDDVLDIEKDATNFLRHKCSMRCLKRIAYNGDENDFVCRKPNYSKISDDCTKHTFKKLNNEYSYDVLNRLKEIGIVQELNYDPNGTITSYKCDHPFFNPKRHIPRTNRSLDLNMSPVESKTFCAMRSMQNIQLISGTNGMNKYVCKYIVKIDENSLLRIDSSRTSENSYSVTEIDRTNTKVTSSNINEEKALEGKKKTTILLVDRSAISSKCK